MRSTETDLVLTRVALLRVGGVIALVAVVASTGRGDDGGSKRRSFTDLDLVFPKSKLLMSLRDCPTFLNVFITDVPKNSLSSYILNLSQLSTRETTFGPTISKIFLRLMSDMS